MDENEIKSALIYYHDLTIYLYFPGVLDNIVFLNPQPVLNKLTQLISISFSGIAEHLGLQYTVPDGANVKLKKREFSHKSY